MQSSRRWQSTPSLIQIMQQSIEQQKHDEANELPNRKSRAPNPSLLYRPKVSLQRPDSDPFLHGRDFVLFEFKNLFGNTANGHHFLFVQEFRNAHPLWRLKKYLQNAIAAGEVRSYNYKYQHIKLDNLEKSCLRVLDSLGYKEDAASWNVVMGKIAILTRRTDEDEAAWFERMFGSMTIPKWVRLQGIVVDFKKPFKILQQAASEDYRRLKRA